VSRWAGCQGRQPAPLSALKRSPLKRRVDVTTTSQVTIELSSLYCLVAIRVYSSNSAYCTSSFSHTLLAMATCYEQINSQVQTYVYGNVYVPCSTSTSSDGFSPCCVENDICVGNGICHYNHSLPGGSGYYMSGCTDPSYQSSACTHYCSKFRGLMSPSPEVFCSNPESVAYWVS
jgi:hypothetical protein